MSTPSDPESPDENPWVVTTTSPFKFTTTLNGQTVTIRPKNESEADRLKYRIEALQEKNAAKDATIQQLAAELERITQLLVVDKIVNDRDCSDAVLRAAYFLARMKIKECLSEILEPYLSREMLDKREPFTREMFAAEMEKLVEQKMRIVDAHTSPIAAMMDGPQLRITIRPAIEGIQDSGVSLQCEIPN
jgi:hypothetical protein